MANDFVISVDMLDEDACRDMWLKKLHPAGPTCPQCGVSLAGVQAETFKSGGKVHCRDCGKWFTNRTGTIVQGLAADWRQLSILGFMTMWSRSAIEIAGVLGVSDDTVRRYQRRFSGGSDERRFTRN